MIKDDTRSMWLMMVSAVMFINKQWSMIVPAVTFTLVMDVKRDIVKPLNSMNTCVLPWNKIMCKSAAFLHRTRRSFKYQTSQKLLQCINGQYTWRRRNELATLFIKFMYIIMHLYMWIVFNLCCTVAHLAVIYVNTLL